MGVLPSPEEYARLAPRPGSPVWRAFNDLAEFGPRYVRWRRQALARGDVARGTAARREPVKEAA